MIIRLIASHFQLKRCYTRRHLICIISHIQLRRVYTYSSVLLLLAAFVPPVGAALALGGMSALALAGMIGGGALVLWNIVYVGVKAIKKLRSGDGKGSEEPVLTDLDGSGFPSTLNPSKSHQGQSFIGPLAPSESQAKGKNPTENNSPTPGL
jgi:hypothetical protein